MNSPIKYRQWLGTEFHYWGFVRDDEFVSPASQNDGVGMADRSHQQYTGLHDKNGREIFEGDIVKEGGRSFAIEWLNERTAFGYRVSTGSVTLYCFAGEVIGNIHEHPELLS